MNVDAVNGLSGKPVVSHEDISAALAELDALQSVTLELVRGGATMSASAVLAQRVP